MNTFMVGVMLFGPALIALLAVVGIILLFGKLNRAAPSKRPALWIGIAVLGALAFGVGSCYAVVFMR